MYSKLSEAQARHADNYTNTFNRRDRNSLLRNGTISYKQVPQLLEVKASGKWGPKLEIRV